MKNGDWKQLHIIPSWFFLFLRFVFVTFNYVYVSAGDYVHISIGTPGGQRLWIPYG